MKIELLKSKVDVISHEFPEHWDVSCHTHINSHPFEHLLIDNFFSAAEFQQIQSKETPVNADEIKILHSAIHKTGAVQSEIFDADFLSTINNRYLPSLQNILGVLAEKKTHIFDSTDFHLVTAGADYVHKVHDDVPRKLLSVVIYINPESNNGTFIHQGKYKKIPIGEVQWKQNRAFAFSRSERKSWHSYASNKLNSRFCVVYNLNTDKAYKAHLAEGNYLKYLKKKAKDK